MTKNVGVVEKSSRYDGSSFMSADSFLTTLRTTYIVVAHGVRSAPPVAKHAAGGGPGHESVRFYPGNIS